MRCAYVAAPWLARVCVGLVLVYSGWLKVARPHDFLSSVFQYQLLGPKSATFVAAALPFVELTVGIALLCGLFTLGAASIATTLFFIFTIGQASALVRGLDADCGCFGAGEKVGWASMLRTMTLLGAALFSARRAYKAVAARAARAGAPSPDAQEAIPELAAS